MRGKITILLLGILLVSLVLAVDNTNQNNVPDTVMSPDTSTSPDTASASPTADAKQTATDILNEIKRAAEEAKKNKTLEQENNTQIFTTPLPAFLEKPTRVLFNIKEGEVSLEKFIVLVGCLIIVFIIFLSLLEIFSFSETITALISLVIALGASISGQITKGVEGIYTIQWITNLFGSLNKLTLLLIILAVIVLLIFLKFIFIRLRHQNRIERARIEGQRFGLLNRIFKVEARARGIR